VDHAREKRWCREEKFSFTQCYSDAVYTRFARGTERICRTRDGLKDQSGEINPGAMMTALRDHHTQVGHPFLPHKGFTGVTVCMHAGFGPIRGDQTTGSLVAHLHPTHPTVFVTGSAAPCTGIFKPLWLDVEQPDSGRHPTGVYDPETLFWRHERLHRATLPKYAAAIAAYQADRDLLEANFTRQALTQASSPADQRASFAADCFTRADQATTDWLQRVAGVTAPDQRSWHHALAWKQINTQASMPV
jgi:dipeptidase